MKSYNTEVGTSLDQAAFYLKNDELVAIPTETVYGLAADAFSERAIEKVFRVKGRPTTNPLIVHVENTMDIKHLVQEFPFTAQHLLKEFAPGPLTVLLKRNCILPGLVAGGRPLVAFRIPAHPVTLALLRKTGFPLVAPSANLYTSISPTHPFHVMKNLFGKIPYVLDGGSCNVGIESTVVGFDEEETPVIYRQGAITAEEIKRVAGKVRFHKADADAVSPGMTRLHYSPKTPLYLVDKFRSVAGYDLHRAGVLCYKNHYPQVPPANQFVLSPGGNLQEAARNVYKGLHYLDDLNLDVLIAEKCPDTGLGKTINDRLMRAAHQEAKSNLLSFAEA